MLHQLLGRPLPRDLQHRSARKTAILCPVRPIRPGHKGNGNANPTNRCAHPCSSVPQSATARTMERSLASLRCTSRRSPTQDACGVKAWQRHELRAVLPRDPPRRKEQPLKKRLRISPAASPEDTSNGNTSEARPHALRTILRWPRTPPEIHDRSIASTVPRQAEGFAGAR